MRAPRPESFQKAAPELVENIRSGSHGAFELFYRMEFLNLVHFADSYLHDRDKAQDLAQEALLAVWEHRQQLDPGKNIRSLVFTIARNRTLDELRSRHAPEERCLEDRSVEEYIGRLDLAALMQKVWMSLPPKIGNTFKMSRLGGMKNHEIAQEEGISEKAVEYRMGVALRRFRKMLEQYLG